MPGPRQKIEPRPGKLFLKKPSLGRVHDPVLLPLDDDCPGGQAGQQEPEVLVQQIIEARRQGPGGRRNCKRLPGLGRKCRLPRGQALFGKLANTCDGFFFRPRRMARTTASGCPQGWSGRPQKTGATPTRTSPLGGGSVRRLRASSSSMPPRDQPTRRHSWRSNPVNIPPTSPRPRPETVGVKTGIRSPKAAVCRSQTRAGGAPAVEQHQGLHRPRPMARAVATMISRARPKSSRAWAADRENRTRARPGGTVGGRRATAISPCCQTGGELQGAAIFPHQHRHDLGFAAQGVEAGDLKPRRNFSDFLRR